MTQRIIGYSLLAAVGLVPAAAQAGRTYSNASSDVTISSFWAEGTISAAHNSPDSVQYIGCLTRTTATTVEASCYANSAEGSYRSCRTTAVRMIEAVRSLHSETRLRFEWNSAFECTHIETRSASTEEPLVP
jgi:hypothetical protein